jgi:isopenicillin N synthase-like dioxygenase
VTQSLPVLDVTPLFGDDLDGQREVGRGIDGACRSHGFFAITGHGLDPDLRDRLDAAARRFFSLPDDTKDHIAMSRGGPAWRGWFPLGGELTSGRPDMKEGIYFGSELPTDDPRVAVEHRPLHGPNLFPSEVPELRPLVLEWIDAVTALGQRVLGAMALGLGLERDWFRRHLTADPTILFRIFRYPPLTAAPEAVEASVVPQVSESNHHENPKATRRTEQPRSDGGAKWGRNELAVAPQATQGFSVQEHTDYGLLTLLVQDDRGGLEVRAGDQWIAVPADPDVIVCNIGDMLDRMTGGRYRSTPHRVRNLAAEDRVSFPLFLDPSWDAEIAPLPLDGPPPDDDAHTRWDRSSVHELSGTYGEYLVAKVAKVFPELGTAVLNTAEAASG